MRFTFFRKIFSASYNIFYSPDKILFFRFSVTTALEFAWVDNRVERPPDLQTGSMINLDLDFEKRLWTPDFYV